MTGERQGLTATAESYWTHEEAWAQSRRRLEAASSLPATCYTDSAFFEAEQERVFATSWVCVGVADELRDAGRLLVREVAGRSILITRNSQGELRAFHNSCRHRGTELAEQDSTIGNTIRCPYHRWGYNLDGNLIATPRFAEAGVENFDRADYPLHPVRVDASGCLMFVCLAAETPPLSEWLGDLPQRLAGYGLDGWTERDRAELRIDANWKLISENFQEYYHLTWVHPELAKVSRVEDHFRYQGPGMYCGQTTTPVSGDERNDWLALPPADGLNSSDRESGRFMTLFPNVLLSVLPNHTFVMILQPLAPGVTQETCVWLLPPSTGEVGDDAFGLTRNFWLDVNSEDIDIVSRGQRGLTKGGFTPGRLSPRFEEPLHRFHNMLADRFVGIDRIPDGDSADGSRRYGSGVNPLPYIETPSAT